MNSIKHKSDITYPPVCGLAGETAYNCSGYQYKGMETCRPEAKTDRSKYVQRKPGKRNGCIGNWLDFPYFDSSCQ